jgi:hypothetical protein
MSWIVVWLIAAMVSFVGLFLMAILSPEGYEDENGFHYGKPEDIKDEP